VQGVDVDMAAGAADPAGLADDLELRQLLQQLARDAGALADQHHGFDIGQARRQLAHALDGVVEHLDVMPLQQLEAGQLAHGILVVVENGNFHRRIR
jgi:hypothetical protein